MNIQEIITLVTPYALTLVTFIGVIAKVISAFAKLKKEVVGLKELESVKVQMNEVLEENRELKRCLYETMTKIDHIDRSKEIKETKKQ